MASDSADRIVLVDSFPNSIAAHLAKSRLDAEGIPCFLSNENRPYGPIAGGVRLHVRQQDLAAAQEVLRYQVAPMTVAPDEAPAASDALTCPRCGSPDVSADPEAPQSASTPMRLLALLSASLLGKRYHCFHCGNEFR